MLKQSDGLRLHEANDHVAQDGADGIKPLICGTDISQPSVIQQDLLDDEDSNGLGELTTCLHNTEAQWNDLRRQEEGDRWRRIARICLRPGRARGVDRDTGGGFIFDQGSDDTQRCKP